ncbi:signal transduction histidine kinase [Nocardia pseudobrasiliensis]|uniref:histidine kinase n=2 Tax=Nocardia pseudobrasiliensis TaxID=45979 RepID=A0A370I9K4_9NOCA|nr:signal transduction histidine kinase [Nocardia pseudobrasiliensis]
MDAAVALILFGATCWVGSAYEPAGFLRFDPWAFLLTGWVCLPLAARRIAPMLTLVTSAAGYLAYLTLDYYPSFNVYGPLVAFYTLAATRSVRQTAVGAVLFGAVLFYSAWLPDIPAAVAIAQGLGMPPVVWVLASVSRRLALRNRQLAEATEQLRREQRFRIEHAVSQERIEIARELHDVVAHHISVISMQAGVAKYVFDSDPPAARAAVHTIGDTSRETLEELRRVLKLLRTSDSPPDAEPAPGFGRLEALIERVRGVGVDATLTITGSVDDLPTGLQLTVYRVIQEALTNVIKHAGPCRVTVAVHRDSRKLTATVTNDRGSIVARDPAAGGHGLLGMRERARVYGGTLIARPRAEGGYTVELAVPWSVCFGGLPGG